jgi:hypothetical protein
MPPLTLEREWSKLMDRYRGEISPLMAEYRELLRPREEAIIAPARPEESRLMEEYRALLKEAAQESETTKRTRSIREKARKARRGRFSKRRT